MRGALARAVRKSPNARHCLEGGMKLLPTDKCADTTVYGVILGIGVVSYPMIVSSLCIFRLLLRMAMPLHCAVIASVLYLAFVGSILLSLLNTLCEAVSRRPLFH